MTKEDWQVIHSSKHDDWRTPGWLFDRLNKEFNFSLDAAASPHNALCNNYLMKPAGLVSDWAHNMAGDLQTVFVNPPYGRHVGKWVEKAILEQAKGATVVMLMSACTDTIWWRRAWDFASEVRFIAGRLKFLAGIDGKEKSTAPKGSAIIVFRPFGGATYHGRRTPLCTLMSQPPSERKKSREEKDNT